MEIPYNRLNNCLFSLLILLLFQNLVFGDLDNAGTISSRHSCLRTKGICNHTGKVLATEVIECECDTLTGNGLFKGPKISIVTKDFKFQGVIECEEECVIVTAKPFNHSMCTFTGNGEFKFVVDENLK